MKKSLFVFLSLTAAAFIFLLTNPEAVKSSADNSDLVLKVGSDKESYILGEKINLQFELKDKNNKIVALASPPRVEDGSIKVWIASSNRSFKEYRGAGWGFSDSSKSQKAESFKSDAGILWNGKAPDSSKNASSDKSGLETDYAFVVAGVYFIKATATVYPQNFKSEDDKIVLESEPIQIIMNEPVGNDLEVWNRIKDNGGFGLFMQTGSFINDKADEAQKLVIAVEDIISKYPDSLLVVQLQQGLEKYRLTQAEINEQREQIKNNKRKPQ